MTEILRTADADCFAEDGTRRPDESDAERRCSQASPGSPLRGNLEGWLMSAAGINRTRAVADRRRNRAGVWYRVGDRQTPVRPGERQVPSDTGFCRIPTYSVPIGNRRAEALRSVKVSPAAHEQRPRLMVGGAQRVALHVGSRCP